MGTGIFNVCIGLALVGIGSTGKYKFLFLGDNPRMPMYVGGAVAAFGVFQIIRALLRRKPPVQDD